MAFVVTSGQVQAVQSTTRMGTAYSTPMSIQLSPTHVVTYEHLWRTQPALRTVVGFLARNVAQLGIDPYRRVSATDRVKLTDHPVARLLERPFPGSKLTKYRLLSTIMHDLCIYDNAYLLKLRPNGEDVAALLPMPPRMVTPIGPRWFMPDQYRIRGNAGTRDVNADEMIHIHGYNPDDPRKGVPPIETLRQILAEEHAATSYREQLWRNGARVSGYLRRPKDATKWSVDARARFVNSWQSQYSGDGPATGGTPVLEDGMDFVNSGVSPKDAQYIESRKLTREEVAVAYHVSPVMIGVMEGATFSNVTELHKMLYQDTLPPYLTQISQDFEAQLLEDLDPEAADGTVYIEFNLSEKLRGSFSEQAAALQSAVGAPWMLRAEARSMFNLSEVEGADELIVPLNVLEGGLASPNDTAPDNPPVSEPKSGPAILTSLYDRQRRVVLSRIGAKGTTPSDVFDAARWNGELSEDMARCSGNPPGTHLDWARRINEKTWQRLAEALAEQDPKAGARRVFDELTQEAAR
jgi:HK97 family phage portal protein